MKNFLLLIFITGVATTFSLAQDIPWYRYALTYYKIQTAEDGIFRIYPASLEAAGCSLQGKDPRFLRLYHRGEEVALWVAGAEDGRLDAKDYVDFLGKRNVEWAATATLISNPYVTTYSDTTAFFLVYTLGEPGKRHASEEQLIAVDQPHHGMQLLVFEEDYALGKSMGWGLRSSLPKEGQGWMTAVIFPSKNLEFNLDAGLAAAHLSSISLELGWVGRSPDLHRPLLWLGTASASIRQLPSPQFSGHASFLQSLVLQQEDFKDGKLQVHVAVAPREMGDHFSLAFARLNYQMPAADARSHLAFPRFVVKSLQAVHFQDYRKLPANYLIVGHGQLKHPSTSYVNPLQAYADYRASEKGGGHKTLVLQIEDLYNQFSYGEKNPQALRSFLTSYWPVHQPKYLLLAGRALVPYAQLWATERAVYQRNAPQEFAFPDLVPTGGFPPSDSQFARGLNLEEPAFPAMAVGRIPAKSGQELSDYLEKVKEKERLKTSGTLKILHLVGGMNRAEIERHGSFMENFTRIARKGAQEVEVVTHEKQATAGVQFLNLNKEMASGIDLLTYFGHGSVSTNELDFGYLTDPSLGYVNFATYPLLLINGCGYGNAFGASYSQGEDWLIAPKKGAIAVISNSGLGVDLLLKRSTDLLYQRFFTEVLSLSSPTLGEAMLDAEREFTLRYGQLPEYEAHWSQLILLGDPALRH